MDRWSPYAVGVCIGVLNTIALILLEKPIGCSTAFARTSGMIEKLARGERVCRKPYYQAFPPSVDWEWMLVLGVIIGAALSAWLSGTWALQWVPEMWRASFGPGVFKRVAVALAGSVCMGLGARWAGGCTSGHGISGTAQLAVSSWLAAACFFAGGIATAFLLYRF
ncbi:YeeE/YedE family protein [bacterium]|nr:YeeE/YedE family protein [bacterium]